MKKSFFSTMAILAVGLLFGSQVMAQGRIDLNAAKSSQKCEDVRLDGFSASFSFSSIESQEMNTEKGVFSIISMSNSVAAGNIGDPEVPVSRQLIAVPFGATPVVTVKNYTVDEYKLADFGINKLYPHQASVSKSAKETKFAYNEAAYAAKGFNETLPIAEVSVLGTMRGIQLGALQLNAVRYNASENTIRVYNNIEVEVAFKDADLALTEKTLVNTYSPYFRTVYASLFNERAILDVYDEHPDLWAVPVKILVVANRMFEEAMQPWITWKTEKGFYMDVNYTDEIGTSASAIKSFIVDKYNQGLAEGQTPTFLIIVGDNNRVPQSQMGSATNKVTDLYYYAVAGGSNDYFPDMFHSRFTCETVQEFLNVIDKSMMYEQYTMPDPSYLDNVLLVAGWDSNWNPRVGKPTIQYAMNYYYNAEHGFANVYNFLQTPYNQPYASMNTGVNFVNYTAHGGDTEWSDPQFNVSNANALTNNGKYFLAMGNCCLAANWGYSSKSLGEAMIIGKDKGAYAYIGSPVETYWYEDYYFGVGATSTMNQMPLYQNTTMGVYDATFRDDFNSVSAIPFIGNVAVAYSHANNYQGSVSDQYYWEAYHVLGDGSVCPYHTNPVANNVSHLPTLPIGMDSYNVSADPGSYVGISKDGVLYGAGEIGEEGTADIPITPITSGGDVKIVVTHPQRQPYIATVTAAAMDGAYIAFNDVQCEQPLVSGAYITPNVSLKNVGIQTANNVNVVMSTESEYIELVNTTANIPSIAPEEVVEIADAFSFNVDVAIPNNTRVRFFLTCTSGDDVWECKFDMTFSAPEFDVTNITNTNLTPGNNGTLTFGLSNIGGAAAENCVFEVYSSSNDIVMNGNSFEIPSIATGETISLPVDLSVGNNVELGATYEIAYLLTSGHYSTSGSYILTVGNIMENFETGDFSTYNWQFSGTGNWTIVSNETHSGTYSAKSGSISHSQQTDLILTTEVFTAGQVSFFKKVSSESNYDKLHFYIDNSEKGNWSGEDDWSQVSYPVTAGTHTFKWSYTKDSSVSNGSDCAWIDDIQFPPTSVTTVLAPITDLEAVVEENKVVLSWTASGNATTYVIRRNGEEIASQSNTTFEEIVADGIYAYSVVATDGNGHYSAPAHVTVSVGMVCVDEAEAEFSIYPNPVSGMLNVNGCNAEYSYVMFNGMGQKVAEGSATGSTQINVDSLTRGVYFLHLTTGTQIRVEKVVVE